MSPLGAKFELPPNIRRASKTSADLHKLDSEFSNRYFLQLLDSLVEMTNEDLFLRSLKTLGQFISSKYSVKEIYSNPNFAATLLEIAEKLRTVDLKSLLTHDVLLHVLYNGEFQESNLLIRFATHSIISIKPDNFNHSILMCVNNLEMFSHQLQLKKYYILRIFRETDLNLNQLNNIIKKIKQLDEYTDAPDLATSEVIILERICKILKIYLAQRTVVLNELDFNPSSLIIKTLETRLETSESEDIGMVILDNIKQIVSPNVLQSMLDIFPKQIFLHLALLNIQEIISMYDYFKPQLKHLY